MVFFLLSLSLFLEKRIKKKTKKRNAKRKLPFAAFIHTFFSFSLKAIAVTPSKRNPKKELKSKFLC